MGINNTIYLAEILLVVLVLIIGSFAFKTKKKKGIGAFIGVTIYTFILIFGATFILEKPEMKIDDVVDIEITAKERMKVPKTYYHFKDVTSEVKKIENIDYENIGEYDVTFELETWGGSYIKNVKVEVIDSKKPNIILQDEKEIRKSYREEYIDPGFEAIDENDGDITDRVKVTQEEIDDFNYKIKYEVEDNAGNKTTMIRKVTIVDEISPVLTLNGRSNIIVPLNKEYIESGATATDEKDGDLTDKIVISGEVDTSKEGTYTLIYKVKDKSGNEATKKRIVIVKDIGENTFNEDDIGVIYLTFDDGPSTNVTPVILDILNEKNVEATFFILNYDDEKEDIVKREYNEGHTIGIHGYSHDYSTIYESEEAYMENLTKLQEKIRNSTGYTATITRFPGGSSNTISKFNKGIMTRLTELVVERGFKYFDWNVSSEDAVGAKTADEMYENVIEGLSKSKTNVVLMHDFGKNEGIIEALPRIIDYGIENGYVFQKITEDTPMITHKVFN